MKNIKSTLVLGGVLLLAGASTTSCSLDLGPVDYYGSGSYWQSEAHVASYVDGLHNNLRGQAWNHTIMMGEIRGGQYVDGTAYDGMTTSYGTERLQNLTEGTPGFSNFANIYGCITNCNLFIKQTEALENMDAAKKNYFLGIGYGLRAFYYFDLYRVWGGGPLRLGTEVIDGELDPNKLYKERAKPSEIMAQIKSDVEKSIECFGNQTGFNVLGKGNKVYWNKAASECLAAEVYLWNAKVAVGDQAATPADIDKAITYLKNVENNYGLSLQKNFADVFEAKSNKGNSEIVFAIRYLEGEATNSNASWTYSTSTGSARTSGYLEDGSTFGDPIGNKTQGLMSMAYSRSLWHQYDDVDTRKRATFLGQFRYEDDTNKTGWYLYGIHTIKNIGYINATGDRVYCGDYIYYRLPWVYLSLAEAYNYKGDNANVEKYINLVRERAYGSAWGAEYAYTASDFTENEYAILFEKNKEFVQEGQRWWDLRRMQETKGGKHFVFCERAAMETNDGLTYPVLSESEAHKVLWPLDKAMLDKDPSLKQNKGYADPSKCVEW
jgi:hypothetical protein